MVSYKRKRSYSTLSPVSYKKRRTVPVRMGTGSGGRRLRNSLALRPELKFFDTSVNGTFDNTGVVPATGGQLVLIPQGDTEATRDGRRATIKSIQLQGVIQTAPAASATYSDTLLLYVVLDTQANGAAAAVTDVFTTVALGANMLQLNNSGRFRILKKFVWNVEPSSGVSAAYNSTTKYVSWYKKCDITVDWNGTAGAITEIRSNNIFLIAGATYFDNFASYSMQARVRFVG